MQPISEAVFVQQLSDLHLGRCVTATYGGHHARPHLFTDYVHD
jgi:hypothetical protein